MGLYQRLTKHGVLLRDNAHKTPHLQNAWNRYGEGALSFRVIEFCDGEQTSQSLLDRENFHLLRVRRDMLFNVYVPAILGGTPYGTKMSDATRQLMSQQRKGRPCPKNRGRKPTDEQRAAQSERSKLLPREHFVKMANARTPECFEHTKGEGNGRSVLVASDVLAIRAEYDAYMTNGALPNGYFSRTARRYGVRYGAIIKICRRQSWTSISEST